MRVLIVKTSSMGDIVHALPVAADIARARPGTVIDWVAEEAFAALPALSPFVHTVHRIALRRWRTAPFGRATWHELTTARRALRAARYDLVLDLQGLLKSALVARWARAPVAGFDAASAREPAVAALYRHRYAVPRTLHATERCRRLAALALGYPLADPADAQLRVPASASGTAFAAGAATADAQSPAPRSTAAPAFAVLLPNASRPSKRWPDDRWLALERWLAAQGLDSRLLAGSPAERERTAALSARMQRATLAPRGGLDEAARLLADSQLVIGLDTGLTHLAAALGRPTVGIYCDYDPALVGGAHAREAALGGVGVQPPVDEVIAAAERVQVAPAP